MGGDVQAALLAAAPSLPHKDLGRLYPATMQDAVAVVHARLEENKKKAAASKQKSKSKGGAPHSPSDSHFPGARPGGGDPSAFWLYIEVRREEGWGAVAPVQLAWQGSEWATNPHAMLRSACRCSRPSSRGSATSPEVPPSTAALPTLTQALCCRACPTSRTTSGTSARTTCGACCRCCATHGTIPHTRWARERQLLAVVHCPQTRLAAPPSSCPCYLQPAGSRLVACTPSIPGSWVPPTSPLLLPSNTANAGAAVGQAGRKRPRGSQGGSHQGGSRGGSGQGSRFPAGH